MQRGARNGVASALSAMILLVLAGHASAITIGVDDVHGPDAAARLASGSDYDALRGIILGLGYTIQPLSTYDSTSLAGVDALLIPMSYVNFYTASERAAIQAFPHNAVFVSDSSMFKDTGAGSDRDIDFGDNARLLT